MVVDIEDIKEEFEEFGIKISSDVLLTKCKFASSQPKTLSLL